MLHVTSGSRYGFDKSGDVTCRIAGQGDTTATAAQTPQCPASEGSHPATAHHARTGHTQRGNLAQKVKHSTLTTKVRMPLP